MRFISFSRGVFETTSLARKDRKWGRNYLLVGLILIGGVIGGFKYWSNNRSLAWGSGGGNGFISPLPAGEAFAKSEAGRSDDGEGTSEGKAERGTEDSSGNGQDNGTGAEGQGLETGGSSEGGRGAAQGGQGGDSTGDAGTQSEGADRQPQQETGLGGGQEESNQGSQPTGEDGGGNSGEVGGSVEGSVRAGSQEEKETLKAYLQEKSSPLGDYVDVLYQEELDAGILNLSRLVVAIAGAEQNFGKVPNFHNAWGIKCGSNTYCHYVSLEEGIKAIVSLLRKPLYGLNGQVTEQDIWRIAGTYAESPKWPYDVAYFWREIEGR